MEDILKEQKDPGAFHEEYDRGMLNVLLLLIAREKRPEKAPGKSSRIGEVIRYIHSHYQEDSVLKCWHRCFMSALITCAVNLKKVQIVQLCVILMLHVL